MKLFGSIKELISAVFRKNGKEITLQPNSSDYSGVSSPTVEFPPPTTGTVVLVAESTTQNLSNKTFTNPTVVSVNDSGAALRITQTGAGNAIVVEDSSPDSTPFVVDASGNVGIGKTAPTVPLDVVGNIATTGTITATGNITTSGDAAINGGDITTTATTFNLINATATTINLAGAATSLNIGGTTAGSTTNVATGVLTTGTKTVNVGTGATGGTTAVNIGAANGTTTINSGTLAGSSATQAVFNTPTTVTAFNAATSLALGNTATAAQTVNMFTASTGASTYNLATGATTSGTTKTLNIGTGGVAGSTTNINIGSAAGSGTVVINEGVTLSALNSAGVVHTDSAGVLSTSQIVDGDVSLTAGIEYGKLNLRPSGAGAIVNDDISASAAIAGSKLQAASDTNAGAITTGAQIFAGVKTFNSNPNMAGLTASQAVVTDASKNLASLGYGSSNTVNTLVQRDASGNFNAGAVTLTGDIGVNGGDITTTATTFNLVNATATTVNAAGAATTLNVGGTTATSTSNFASGATIASSTKTVNVGTGGVSGSTTNVNIGSSVSGALNTVTFNGTNAVRLPSGTTAQQPGQAGQPAAANGMIRYNSSSNTFEGYASNAWSPIGSGGTTDKFTQASPALAVGDVVYLNGSVYTKAIATAANTSEIVGVISRDPTTLGTDNYEVTLSGEVSGFTGLTTGEVYFLSPTTAGGITVTEPSTIGQVSVPVGIASSATSLYIAPKRGVVVGGTNARTQITLTAVTTAQTIYTAPAGLDAGELTGWVYLDATTDRKFYVSAPFAKNGAGTDWNISPSYVGDTPPTGFGITMTSTGLIQVTMNPLPTGFVSGYINYALNAPAVGATFPLAVSGSSVTGGTPLVDTVNENTLNNGVQIQGRKSGVAIPAGYVGETVQGTVTNSVSLTTSYASITGTSINLSPGIWMIYAQVSLNLNIPANSGSNFTQLTGSVQLATSTGTNLTERSMYLQSSAQTAFGMVIANYVPINHVVNITSTTIYQLNGKYTVAGTNPGVSVTTNNAAPTTSVFYAVRIA